MNRSFVALTALSICLAATLSAGCGGSSSTEPSGDPSESSCHGTVSGSVTATITDCSFTWTRNASQSSVGNDGHIFSTADDDGQFSALGFTFLFPSAAAMPRTLDGTSVEELGGGLTLANGGGYNVSKPGYGHTGPTFGTAKLTITSVEPTNLPDQWKVHGTLAAALKTPPGVTTYSGSADVAITF